MKEISKAEKKKILKRFRRLLHSYADFISIPKKGFAMREIEDALHYLFLHTDIETKAYTDIVIAAFAAIVGMGNIEAIGASMLPVSDDFDFDRWMERKKNSRLQNAANWVAHVTCVPEPSFLNFFRKRVYVTTIGAEEAKSILEKLRKEYFSNTEAELLA